MRTNIRIVRTRETVMFVRVKVAFEVRRDEVAAEPTVATGFSRAVTETKVWVTVLITLVFVDKVVVMSVETSVFVAKVVVVVVEIMGRIVRFEVTVVELGGVGEKPKSNEGNGNGNPEENPIAVPVGTSRLVTVTDAVGHPPPFV
jgi:hypothetical protein